MKPSNSGWEWYTPEERKKLLAMTDEERWELNWAEMVAGADGHGWKYRDLVDDLQKIESTPEADRTDQDRWLLGKLNDFFAAHPNEPPAMMFDNDWDLFTPATREKLLAMTNDERREMEWVFMANGSDRFLSSYELLVDDLKRIESTPEGDRTDRDRWLLGKLRAFFAAHPNPPPPDQPQP